MPRSDTATSFVFKAEGIRLSELSLDRVRQYLGLIAGLMGHSGKVHLKNARDGSAVLALAVASAAVPGVHERLAEARRLDGGKMRARWQALDDALAEDGATGQLAEEREGGIVIPFPGAGARADALPAFWQTGELRGRLVTLHGRDETKHGELLSASGTSRFECTEALALELRSSLFDYVRISGRGRWQRGGDGSWRLLRFKADAFGLLENHGIAGAAAGFRRGGGLGLPPDVHDILREVR